MLTRDLIYSKQFGLRTIPCYTVVTEKNVIEIRDPKVQLQYFNLLCIL